MSLWFTYRDTLLVFALMLPACVNGLPLQTSKTNQLDKNGMRKQAIDSLNKQLSLADTEGRISRIFYAKNISFEEGEVTKQMFGMFLNSNGIGKMADVISMSWIEISSVKGPFTNGKERLSKCKEVLHPDHLLSNVILENLLPRNRMMGDEMTKEQVIEDMALLFCNQEMKSITLHYMHTDDVISGLAILSIENDGSALFLGNIGF